MGEVDKNEVQRICWRTFFIAIVFLAIGAAFGHVMTVKCCPMRGPWGGGPGMKSCWDRGRECGWGHKFLGEKGVCGKQKSRCGYKSEMGKCKPGCTCPKCLKKAACTPDPNKAGCPMMGKKEVAPEKD